MNAEAAATYLFEIDLGQGVKPVLSVLPPEEVFEHGLPTQAVVGAFSESPRESEPLDPHKFQPNSAFLGVLHAVIAEHGRDLPELVADADRRGVGHVSLVDKRTPDPMGQIPDEDIIGSFDVRAGELGTYRPDPQYALYSERGLFSLEPGLYGRLLERIRDRFL